MYYSAKVISVEKVATTKIQYCILFAYHCFAYKVEHTPNNLNFHTSYCCIDTWVQNVVHSLEKEKKGKKPKIFSYLQISGAGSYLVTMFL